MDKLFSGIKQFIFNKHTPIPNAKIAFNDLIYKNSNMCKDVCNIVCDYFYEPLKCACCDNEFDYYCDICKTNPMTCNV
jgi:hypothetical protein